MTPRRIIITGAAGFVGSNLTRRLLDAGHQVIGIDNFSYGSRSNLEAVIGHERFTFLEADLCDPDALKGLEGDTIVHLASQKIPRYTNSYRTIEENNTMTSNVIARSLELGARLVFASTSDVYGKNPKIPFSEESDLVLGPTKVKRWAYAASKIHSEHKLIATGEEKGLKYTILRLFGSYGPNQNMTWWGGPQSVFIGKALRNETIELHGTGQQTRTFTYVEDTIQGFHLCIEKDEAENEVFNVGSDPSTEVTIEGLARLIWKLIRPEDAEPKLTLIPYSSFGGGYEDVLRRVPDISKISRMLGFKPKFGLEEGLKLAIEWQRRQPVP
ncbi:MAG: NAD-dependent epimerase/dehydratase family protein [Flavobacteriales bacterium]|nr:NAD-dependent epimerase/dehydratase family protein [Flavobacteriales bacterium]MCC6936966.1 NAD-dependent epimerase/dehydratase family protein [Flavobacteriales bacterium]